MTTATVNPHMRAVLDAPRGRRFSPPVGTAGPTREQRLLAKMKGNPRVAHRLENGVLPKWMLVAEEKRERRNQNAPRPTTPERDRAIEPRGGGRHRSRCSRRRRGGWGGLVKAISYAVAVVGGALVGQAVILLL